MNAMPPSAAAVEISDAEFDALTAIAEREAGLAIPKSKKSLVQSRIARRFRSLKISNCKDYLELLSHSREETRELVSVLTTNVSSFYREAHHFEFLRQTAFPKIKDRLSAGKPVRIWSAGCSSGQEPYTIAVELAKAFPDFAGQDLLVLASDIDPKILEKAKLGVYSDQDLASLAPADRERFFPPVAGSDDLLVEPEAGGVDPVESSYHAEVAERVREAVQELPDDFRSCVIMRDLQGMSYEEIAEVIGVPPGTVRSRIHRGRVLLQQKLREFRP